MKRIVMITLMAMTGAVAAGCATTASTGGLATPVGVHSFKPQTAPAEPSAAKVDKQIAQLLDDASQATKDADVRVAAAH